MKINNHCITKREKEVLHQISFGLTTKEIAEHLYLSAHTVNCHRKNLLQKTSANNTAALVRFGFEMGILDLARL